MTTKLGFRREIDGILEGIPSLAAGREDIVFKLLTPEEVDLVGGGDNTGYCMGPGGGGYTQSGGSFSQSGGTYNQSGGTYNMTCPQPSGPR